MGTGLIHTYLYAYTLYMYIYIYVYIRTLHYMYNIYTYICILGNVATLFLIAGFMLLSFPSPKHRVALAVVFCCQACQTPWTRR